MTKIAIIVGSSRPGRKGRTIAEWVLERASERLDADFEIVDLADHDLPHLDEPVPAAMSADYAHEHTRAWSARIAAFDGYVFVTPEYNHSIPSVLKNALDYLYAEWRDKAAGSVGYGVDGGVRAVEQLRLILAELHLATVREQVALSLFDDFDDRGAPAPRPHHLARLDAMLDHVVSWTDALAVLRPTTAAESEPASRPALGSEDAGATAAVAGFVDELQAGIDHHDATIYNRHFAADVLWGSPYGATVDGYDDLHAIHLALHRRAAGGPSSRYEIVRVLAPTPDLAIAQVRRVALDAEGQPIEPTASSTGAFSEMALYVLVRRTGTWWLAAGQNTPIATPPAP